MKRLAALAMLVSAAFSVQAAVDPDLKPVRISGLGLGSLPDALKPRLRVRLFLSNDEHDVFPTLPPEDKFRVFATNEVGALPLGGGGADLLDVTGATCPWRGDDPAMFWVEGLVHGASASLTTEVSLDGSVIGRDTIRIRVAPFLVLSNCDVAEKLFYANPDDGYWDDFEADVTNALAGFLPAARCPHAPFPQDVAEIGWSGLGTNGNPSVWSMMPGGFSELLFSGVGVFDWPSANKMGGNVEAIPPTSLHPRGRIVVGSNLPESAKAFLLAQEVQADGDELIELPLDWLVVGHVDEVMAVIPVPGGNDFKVFVGDLDLAIQMLRLEISDIDELLGTNPDDASLLAKRSFLQTCLTPYEANSSQSDVATVRNRLSSIRNALASGAGLDSSDIVSVPVLYPLLNVPATHPREADHIFPNPLNLVALKKAGGECRILVPHAGIVRILECFSNQFESLGYLFGDIWIIDTTGPHMWFGEAHCGSNAFRRK